MSEPTAVELSCLNKGSAAGFYPQHAATVHPELPILARVRLLTASGDRIHSILGLLSVSLNWLLAQYDHKQSFCSLLDTAQQLGLTEVNPLTDLTGLEVARTLGSLAREAHLATNSIEMAVTPVTPRGFKSDYPFAAICRDLLDRHFSRMAQVAVAQQKTLRYVARIGPGDCMSASLESVPLNSVLALAHPGDKIIEIYSDRFRNKPLVIREPWTGPGTAAGIRSPVPAHRHI